MLPVTVCPASGAGFERFDARLSISAWPLAPVVGVAVGATNVGVRVGVAVGAGAVRVGVAVEPPLLTVKFAVMTVVAPEVSVIDAVIECAPLARFAVLYGFAAETVPPAKSHGGLLSVHVGVPDADGLSR